jgi:hypothetical protein
MPVLTRCRKKGARQESWHIYFGDVQVGWIGEGAGVPKDVDQWGWSCGFNPRGQHLSGIAASLNQARADFERAWREYQSGCTNADFEAHRRQRASTAWKYAMWDAGCRMPTQAVDGRTRCFCGEPIDVKSSSDHIYACHMELVEIRRNSPIYRS